MFIKHALICLLWLTGASVGEGCLLPLESFFSEPSRFNESLSQNGKWVAFLGPDDRGTISLWAVEADHPDVTERISTEESDAVAVYFWLKDDGMLWQTNDRDGRPHFFTGGPHANAAREIPTDTQRVVSLAGVAGAGDDPCILLGISESPTAYPDLYRIGLHGDSQPERIFSNQHRVFMWALDAGGRPVAGLRWTDRGAKEILDLRNGAGTVVFRAEPGDDARLLAASADGTRLFVVTNRGTDLTHLESLDLTTGTSATIASDPLGRVDLEQVVMDSGSTEILAAGYLDGGLRWQSLHPAFAALERGDAPVDLSDVASVQFSADRKRCLIRRTADREPGSIELLDVETSKMRMLWRERPDIDRSALCQTQPLTYTARDGTRIPAFLTTPATGHPPWPLVVFPHGGPHMRTFPGYDGRVQFLASRGYAVLQPNFRGSRGYGKTFLNAGDGQWGTGVMQTDLADGAGDLLRQGIAAKGRIAILGGSYGGYAALAGLAFTPDLYAAGVCLFGISDLNAYVSQVPTEWEPFAGDLVRQLGDPTTSAGHAALAARSPLQHAAAVTAPLLIYHGLKDPLIPARNARSMVAALRSADKPCIYLAAPDESHGFARPESEMAVYRAIEIFLHEHIGGGVGAEPSQAVRTRLEELRAAGVADAQQQR